MMNVWQHILLRDGRKKKPHIHSFVHSCYNIAEFTANDISLQAKGH